MILNIFFILFMIYRSIYYMKFLLILSIVFLSVESIFAQIDDLHIVASSGNSFQTTNLELDWTLGEPVIITMENENILLTNGFHQPTYDVISSTSHTDQSIFADIFPNPFTDQLNILVSIEKLNTGNIELIDLTGHCVWDESFSGKKINTHLNSSSLPSGLYFITIANHTGQIAQSFPVVKL